MFNCRLLFYQGLRPKGYSNKPIFACLSALIYQHTLILHTLCLELHFKMSSLFDQSVKLKGYSNEPVFASLSALIYQHTLISLALSL